MKKRTYTFVSVEDAAREVREISDDDLEDITSTIMENIVAESDEALRTGLTRTLILLDDESMRRERKR